MTREQLAQIAQEIAESVWLRDAQGLPIKCAAVVILHLDELPNFIGVGTNTRPERALAMITDAAQGVDRDGPLADAPPPTGEQH